MIIFVFFSTHPNFTASWCMYTIVWIDTSLFIATTIPKQGCSAFPFNHLPSAAQNCCFHFGAIGNKVTISSHRQGFYEQMFHQFGWNHPEVQSLCPIVVTDMILQEFSCPFLELLPILHRSQQGMRTPLLLHLIPMLAIFSTFIYFNHNDVYCGFSLHFSNDRIPRNSIQTDRQTKRKRRRGFAIYQKRFNCHIACILYCMCILLCTKVIMHTCTWA